MRGTRHHQLSRRPDKLELYQMTARKGSQKVARSGPFVLWIFPLAAGDDKQGIVPCSSNNQHRVRGIWLKPQSGSLGSSSHPDHLDSITARSVENHGEPNAQTPRMSAHPHHRHLSFGLGGALVSTTKPCLAAVLGTAMCQSRHRIPYAWRDAKGSR